MDFTTERGRLILRQIKYQLSLAKRRRGLVDVADLASRLARKHHRSSKATVELSNEIILRAAKAGLPIYLSRSGRHWTLGRLGI
jgi:hypothetical protein